MKTNTASVNQESAQPSEHLEIVKLTESAIAEVQRRLQSAVSSEEKASTTITSPNKGLRLGVKGGGCSGLSYVIDISAPKENDHVYNQHGFPIFIDPKSGLYLKDVELDYESGFMGSGFKFKNPSAANTCGCGESFSV